MMNNAKRVVITGLGVVSPYGEGIDILWNSVIAGKSAIDKITSFDTTDFTTKIAGEARNFNPENYMNKKEVKRYDRFLQFSKAAVQGCMEDSGLKVTEELAPRIGVSIGSGIGGMKTWEDTHEALISKGPSRVSPFFIPMMLVNMASGLAAMDFGLKGPNVCLVTACATGAHNIGLGYDLIKSGKATLMVVGGSDASITPLAVAGFSAMKALSSANDEPQKASRPFDIKRDGFVMSEGAAVLLLEELEHAKARGAKIYGEVIGHGASADAYHITQPDPDGLGAAAAMRIALDASGIKPEQIDYINAHGTSTPLGDIAETKAIKAVFGDHANKLVVSSTKSMHGHLLGAAGALEGLISVLATKHDMVPPTINQVEADPECDLDYVPNVARKKEVNYALSNSFGFGGTNAVLVFKKYREE
jgi:3-oxoacyl-[acyl-carrier-protein] synthase II